MRDVQRFRYIAYRDSRFPSQGQSCFSYVDVTDVPWRSSRRHDRFGRSSRPSINFDSPEKVALGMNMLQAAKRETTVRLRSLDQTGQVDDKAGAFVRLMGRYARPMLVKQSS
jgi:hypothetical protein